MYRLTGVIRNYEWGDRTALARVLGHEPSGQPEAEYWLGAHPGAPSTIGDGGETLDAAISSSPGELLGRRVADRFDGKLPFLLKILAAAEPLSIQAHPSSDQARRGFEREELAGIDRSAPHRNYRDPNHKPELICALTPFEAKCGFRPVADTIGLLKRLDPEVLGPVIDRLSQPEASSDADRLAAAVEWLLRLPEDEATELVRSTVAAASAASVPQDPVGGEGDELGTVDEFGSIVRWTRLINEHHPDDVGVVVALLLNHLTLRPGQAVFLAAGNLHAYLQGVGVELMANSDNVIRGGLTPKHVDVEELLAVVDYRPIDPPVQNREGSPTHYRCDTPEFGLQSIIPAAGGEIVLPVSGPEILLVTDGVVSVSTGRETTTLRAGDAVFIAAGDEHFRLFDAEGAQLWRALVP